MIDHTRTDGKHFKVSVSRDGQAIREPCGARNPWPGDNPPCGRPEGHDDLGGQWAGGHQEVPRIGDSLVKEYRRRWIVLG